MEVLCLLLYARVISKVSRMIIMLLDKEGFAIEPRKRLQLLLTTAFEI